MPSVPPGGGGNGHLVTVPPGLGGGTVVPGGGGGGQLLSMGPGDWSLCVAGGGEGGAPCVGRFTPPFPRPVRPFSLFPVSGRAVDHCAAHGPLEEVGVVMSGLQTNNRPNAVQRIGTHPLLWHCEGSSTDVFRYATQLLWAVSTILQNLASCSVPIGDTPPGGGERGGSPNPNRPTWTPPPNRPSQTLPPNPLPLPAPPPPPRGPPANG